MILKGTANPEWVHGGDEDDILYGLGGNDYVWGERGDDILIGGAGADNMNGFLGNDTASYQNAPAAISVSLTTQRGTRGDAQGDTLSDIENIVGSNFDDTIVGDNNANVLRGQGGNDNISGMLEDDLINPGKGDDTINGGGAAIARRSTATIWSAISASRPG